MANTAFRVIPGHGDVAVPCRYSGHSLFGERAQQRDPYAPLCGIRHIQPRHLISGGLCDIDDCLVRRANFAQIYVDHSRSDAAFIRGRIVSTLKTDLATGPNKALYATQPCECARRCTTSAVRNDCGKSLSTNSFAYPKTGDQATAIRAKGNKGRR